MYICIRDMETIQQYESNLMWISCGRFEAAKPSAVPPAQAERMLIQPLVDTVDGCEILQQLIGVLSHYL